jgi:hypothetical protein
MVSDYLNGKFYGKIAESQLSTFRNLPAFAECPVRKDGDECKKGIRRSSRLPKNLPACTKRFGEGRFGGQVSVGVYASAGFAEVVKMPRAEGRGASLGQFGLSDDFSVLGV